jgi:hypothetical protein
VGVTLSALGAAGRRLIETGAALVLVLLALAPAAWADSSTGTITGTVVDQMTGQPVSGAFVSTQDASTGGWNGVNSDAQGEFTLSGLSPGSYTVYAASFPQYQDTTFGPITLAAGETVQGVRIEMKPVTGNLTGRVTDPSGAPLAGMQVQLSDSSGASQNGWSAYSNASGGYTIKGVPAGTYTVTVLDGVTGAAPQQPVQPGDTTINGGHTTTDDLHLPAPQVPPGTAARNSERDLAWLNAERVANGLPGGIVLNQRWSTDCAAHDAYERANGGGLTHYETTGRGFSPGGYWVGQTSILAASSTWAAAANPFETAPIHLDQLYSPSLSVAGIDDGSGDQCVTTWAGMQSTFASDTVFTYPGNGVEGVPPSENAAEEPFVPGQFVGLPQGTTAGRELFVYLNQAGVMGQAQVQFASVTLTGPQGPVAVKTVDNATPKLGPYLAGGIIIPVKPLAPQSTYTASVTLANGSATISHTWSFRTGTNAVSPSPQPTPAGCVVPRLHHMSLAHARRALRTAGCKLGKVHKPRHRARHHVLRVRRQSPRAGSRRSAGTRVSVVLG